MRSTSSRATDRACTAAVAGSSPGSAISISSRPLGADELAAALRTTVLLGDAEVTVGATVGLAVYPDDGEEFDTLLHAPELDRDLARATRRSTAPLR